ncbi:MAG TPA: PQQ-dependent sugar dehydrogenase [Polyangiaceae bacterium]|nr:PQQ-dependent sugar dehydrogenase [Polyangiaceae bacterium]
MGRFLARIAPLVAGGVSGSTASAATLTGAAQTDLQVAPLISGLSQPTDIAVTADGRAVIPQRRGQVIVFTAAKQKVDAGTITVNINNDEQGLLGVVLDPDFATNHFVYFFADVGANDSKHQVLRYVLGDDNKIVTRTVIMGDGAPTPGVLGDANHNGGTIQILNGFLFVSIGDTGKNAPVPTNRFASCLNRPNGKILRLKLDGTIPDDNPLSKLDMVTGCTNYTEPLTMQPPDKRIYAWGLRNPFRFWADPKTGHLWIGDVGEVMSEEISIHTQGTAGQHFGYPFEEGSVMHNQSFAPAGKCQGMTPAVACTPPLHAYPHVGGKNCVIGGVITDACGWSDAWKKRYIFGDHGTGDAWTLEVNADRSGAGSASTPFGKFSPMSAFRMGPDNALYVVEVDAGAVQKVTPKTPTAGCMTDAGVVISPDSGGGRPDASLGTGGNSSTGGGASGVGGSNSSGSGETGTGGTTSGPGATATGTSSGAGGSTGANPGSSDGGGCGCRSVASGKAGLGAGLAIVGFLSARLLRRRRRDRTS